MAETNYNRKLNSYVDRLLRLKDEQDAAAAPFKEDRKALMDEAKDAGLNPKAIREAARLRRLDKKVRDAVAPFVSEHILFD